MTSFTAIDLSKLPAPAVVEPVLFEAVLADMIRRYSVMVPELADSIQYESDPIRKLLEIAAYEKTLTLSRVNTSATAVMLAFAEGSDLDNLAALIPLARLDGESDENFRARVQLAPEGFSVAGPRGGYEFHAFKADPSILDVHIDTFDPARVDPSDPTPGDVHVYVLAHSSGALPAGIEAKVLAAVNHDDVRPLTDRVSVKSPGIVTYDIEAELTVSDGPDPDTVREAATAFLQIYVDEQFKLGGFVTRSGITAALHVAGVLNVALTSPAADVATTARQVPVCNDISVTLGGA